MTIVASRRGFLLGLGAALAAPAIVRAASLMPVKALPFGPRIEGMRTEWLPCVDFDFTKGTVTIHRPAYWQRRLANAELAALTEEPPVILPITDFVRGGHLTPEGLYVGPGVESAKVMMPSVWS